MMLCDSLESAMLESAINCSKRSGGRSRGPAMAGFSRDPAGASADPLALEAIAPLVGGPVCGGRRSLERCP